MGSGSYGTVIAGIYNNQHVAVKYSHVLDPQSFIRELSALSTMSGTQHIIQIVGVDIPNRVIYMERAHTSLRELIGYDRSRALMNHTDVQRILYQILYGTYCLNRSGIWHRDIKPENILVTADETVKITDFGLSRGGPFEPTNMSTNVYTLHYRAPELILNEPTPI